MSPRQDPARWLGPDGNVPDSLRDALRAAARGPDPAQLEGLARAAELGAAGISMHASLAKMGTHAVSTAVSSKIVALAAVASVAGSVWIARSGGPGEHSERSPVVVAAAPSAMRAPVASAVPPGDTVLAVEDRGEPAPPSIAPSPHPAPAHSTHAPSVRIRRTLTAPARDRASSSDREPAPAQPEAERSTLEEIELLAQARALLPVQPDRALALARDHERRFPRGRLAQERDALILQALRRLGLATQAQKAEETFHASYPGSPYDRAVEGTNTPNE